MITNVFLSVFGISASVSLLVAALILLTPFLDKRYAAKWKCLIWIVLAVRLLIPFGGTYGQSGIYGTLSQMKTQTAAESEKDPAGTLPEQTTPPGRVIVEIPAQMTTPIATHFSMNNALQNTLQSEKSNNDITPLDLAALIWMIGSLAFLSLNLASYLHYKRQIMKNGTVIKDIRILRPMSALKYELHIKRAICAIEDPEAASPMIIGFLHPVLALPKERYSEGELYFILKHELIHLKRGDVYFKLLFAAANAVHWFNPFIWIMQKEAAVDLELSCDEKVTQGEDYAVRKAYTETLLSMLHKRCAKRTILSTQFYGGKQIMKKRFKNILRKKEKKNGISILISSVILTFALGTLIGCSVREADNSKPIEGIEGMKRIEEIKETKATDTLQEKEGQEPATEGYSDDGQADSADADFEKKYITIMREGEMEEIPATQFTGEGYSIYLTDDEWSQYAADAWLSTVDGQPVLNGKVQIWVAHFEKQTINQVREKLADDGYLPENYELIKQEDEIVYKVILSESQDDIWGVFYCYPMEAEEGWGRILPVIADTFTVSPSTNDALNQNSNVENISASLKDTDRQEIQNIVKEFAAAYFDGNADAIQKFLTDTYEGKISTYKGAGTASDFTVKGLSDTDEQKTGNGAYVVSLEYRDSDNADTFQYLTFTFAKEKDEWKIEFYGLEG